MRLLCCSGQFCGAGNTQVPGERTSEIWPGGCQPHSIAKFCWRHNIPNQSEWIKQNDPKHILLESDSGNGPGTLDPHLVYLLCAVTPGSQAHHAKGSWEAQRTEEEVFMMIIFAYLLEKIKAKFGVCCNQRLHPETDDSLKPKTKQNREREHDD